MHPLRGLTVMRTWARMPLVLFVLLLAVACFRLPVPPRAEAAPMPAGAPAQGTVYVARNLSPENLAILAAALGREPSAVLLIDTPTAASANKTFLAALKPTRVVPLGDYSEEIEKLEERLGCRPETPHNWTRSVPVSLWKEFYHKPETVVVCPARPRGLLLQAACLAGTIGAPRYVSQGNTTDAAELQFLLDQWKTLHVYSAGPEESLPCKTEVRVTHLKCEQDVAALQHRHLAAKRTIRTLVVVNPFDGKDDKAGMSGLASWLTLKRNAALVLTNKDGTNVDEVVGEAVKTKALRQADTVILAADLEAIPVVKRKNPIPADKDEFIEMEPLTPLGSEPFSFSVGRLFHQDQGVVPLMMQNQLLMARATKKASALIVSNVDGSLPLLETISRQTVREMTNAGYQTTALYGKKLTAEEVRREMPKHNIFLWEGHHNTIIREWKFPEWTEPSPALVFLQSCLALRESKVEGLFRRGAVGVIGSSTRTYSASGGATSLAFFDGLLYEDQSTGAALRQAKNFLQAYVLLKDSRLGDDAKRTGANQRSAWAFTLWGDPTVKMPHGEASEKKVPPVTHSVKSNVITVQLPATKLDPVRSEKYHAEAYANARLAGLLGKKEKGEDGKGLLPMVFVEVALPKAPEGKVPHLTSKLPSKSWVFNWDGRRKVGYLLAVPREKDKDELRFVFTWEDAGQKATAAKMSKAGRE